MPQCLYVYTKGKHLGLQCPTMSRNPHTFCGLHRAKQSHATNEPELQNEHALPNKPVLPNNHMDNVSIEDNKMEIDTMPEEDMLVSQLAAMTMTGLVEALSKCYNNGVWNGQVYRLLEQFPEARATLDLSLSEQDLFCQLYRQTIPNRAIKVVDEEVFLSDPYVVTETVFSTKRLTKAEWNRLIKVLDLPTRRQFKVDLSGISPLDLKPLLLHYGITLDSFQWDLNHVYAVIKNAMFSS